MQYFSRYLVLLAGLFLTGCFDFSQEIWINEDASGRVQYGIKLHKGLSALSRDLNISKNPCLMFFHDEEYVRQQPGVKSVKVTSYEQNELKQCLIDIVVEDYRRLNELQDRVFRDNKATNQKNDFITRFELKNNENGTGAFQQTIGRKKVSSNNGKDSEFDREAEKLANMMLLSVLGDSFWSVTLHAPGITSANGKLTEDHKTVSWNILMSDILAKSDLILELQAEFDFDLPWYKRVWKWVN